jgi:muramidase (phage lysozyme)
MRIADLQFTVLGQVFKQSDSKIKDVQVQLAANGNSSIDLTLVDPDLAISDHFYKWSKSQGGIKVPAQLRGSGSSTTTPTPTPTDPTNPVPPGNGNGGSTTTEGKLEGLEDLPLSFSAFLETIGWCENRGYSHLPGWANLFYNVRFGGFLFYDYSKHPDIVYCSGGLCSNAAGAFQFIGGDPSQSWGELLLLYPNELPGSFLPKYQNIGAMLAIRHYASRSNNAYNRIINGTDADIIAAARGLSWYWASLPGAPYGQPTVTEDMFLAKYKECLKKRESSYNLNLIPNTLHSIEKYGKVDTTGWKACKPYSDVRKQVTITFSDHGNEDEVYEAVRWLVETNKLEGNWCMVSVTDGTTTPGWRSKEFAEIGDELYTYQAIFHVAGLFVYNAQMKPIPGFNAPGQYVKPQPNQSPLHPDYPRNGSGQVGDTPSTPGTESGGSNPPVNNPGEKLTIKITTTDNNEFNFSFVLTDTEVKTLPIPELKIRGESTLQLLNQVDNTENYVNVNPQELIKIVGSKYGYRIIDKTRKKYSRQTIEQRNRTDLDFLTDIAKSHGIILVENSWKNEIEIYDSSEGASLVINDILDLTFEDEGVINETPQYPVHIKAITSSNLLALKPESQVSLDNVYTFIPDSLKKGTWVVNTIGHDLIKEVTTIQLQKTIVRTPTVTIPGVTIPGSGQTFTEQQLLERYKSAVVKVGSASGAFITSDGYILTASHMQNNSSRVETLDGKVLSAAQIGIDTTHDFLVLKVNISGANYFSIAPDSKIWDSDKSLETNPIYKLGHGWSTEDGRGEGSTSVKPWDITATNVVERNFSMRGGLYIIANDRTIDFVNPGDSGCPWFDKWGLIVSCTSGGDRTHEEGAGKKDRAYGGETEPLNAFLKRYNIPYTQGSRVATALPTDPTLPTDPGTGIPVINQKIVAAMNALGKFSTTESGLGRNPCAWAVNKVIAYAGYQKVGSNPNYVPSVRQALQSGRGKLIGTGSYQGALPGDIWIYSNSYHIGLFLTSTIVRSSSSSRERFDNDDPDGTLFGTYPIRGDGSGDNEIAELWRLVN